MHLSAEDQRHLKAAEGWLVLGNHVEAHKELDGIEPAHRVHPDVLQLRCAYRHKVPPDSYAYSVGFRVAYTDAPAVSDEIADGEALQ